MRLCAHDYLPAGTTTDVYMSLANHSISKHSEAKKIRHENMMFMGEFEEHLAKQGSGERFKEIKAKISEVIKATILSTKHSVSEREGSFVVLGFDFMIDAQFNVWLLEVNTSPSNDIGTPVTKVVIEEFQRDQAKLYLDFNAFSKVKNEGKAIGKFKCIHKGAEKKESMKDKIKFFKKPAGNEPNRGNDDFMVL